jgi:hypothetical protein
MNKLNREKNSPQSMTETAKKAVNTALLHHKAMGNKVAFIKNGKIVHEIPSNIKKG